MAEIIYFDGFGNAWTGIRSETIDVQATVTIEGMEIRYAGTFAQVSPGMPFWYENSCGLVEIAVNHGNARDVLGIDIGSKVNL